MSQRSILMLTTDRDIDRRILLEADALEADGWEVAILGLPADRPDHDPRVSRVAATGSQAAGRASDHAVLGAYRLARALLPMNGPSMTRMKGFAARYLINVETLVRRLLLPAALARRADVIVAHDLPVLPTAAAAAKHHRAKLVYDSHELYSEQEFGPWVRRMWSGIERRHIGASDAVITVNPSIARELERRYRLMDVGVIHNAARFIESPPEAERLFHHAFALDAADIVVLFQGGLTAGRHLEALVEAMAFTSPSVHLVLLGDGVLERRLRRRAAAHRVAHRVHFHAAVPQAELFRYTASADLGIIPYQATCLNNYYCTPNKLFEFVAAGVPILATDLPELRRLIDGNAIGVVTDTGTPKALAAAIETLVHDRHRMASLRANIRASQRRLSWEEESKTLVEIYRRLMN